MEMKMKMKMKVKVKMEMEMELKMKMKIRGPASATCVFSILQCGSFACATSPIPTVCSAAGSVDSNAGTWSRNH